MTCCWLIGLLVYVSRLVVIDLRLNLKMDRNRQTAHTREERHHRVQNKNKENPVGDAVFLIQNENDVLRMKYIFAYVEIPN